MTVSGVNNFNLVRNQIIQLALARIGAATFNRAPTNAEVEQCGLVLNAMTKSWKNSGINLWKTTQGTLFCYPGQRVYKLDGVSAYATDNYTQSAVSVAALLGANTLTLSSTAGFTIGYNLVVIQDNNTSLFTTITNVAGNVITLATPTTNTVSINNPIFAFQNKIKRPESIDNLNLRRDWSAQPTEIANQILAVDTYSRLPTKYTTGSPIQFWYNKQLSYGEIYLWPVPDNARYSITFNYQQQFFDFTSGISDPDFPQEWLKALYLNLAYEIGPFYGKTPDETLKRDAQQALSECLAYDRENVSIRIIPASAYYSYD